MPPSVLVPSWLCLATAAGCLGGWSPPAARRGTVWQSATMEVATVEVTEGLPSMGRLGGVALDRDGNIYVSDFGARVWRVAPDGSVTTLATDLQGSSGNAITADGHLLQASFVDGRIVEIGRDGSARTVVAEGLDGPVGVASGPDGRIYVCNCRANSVSVARPGMPARTLAAGGALDCPNGITLGPDGDLYVVSFNNGLVARITPGGSMSVLATLPEGRNAHVAWASGSLWVTRIATHEIYRVGLDGVAERVVGSDEAGLDDGPATRARLAHPNGIAASPDGRWLYFNDLEGPWRGDDATRIVLRRLGPLPSAGPESGPRSPVASPQEIESIDIRVGDMVFRARASGPEDGPLVLLLHGFPETSYAFRQQLTALGAAGFRAVAPDQRGYSPGARPDGVEPYSMTHLVEDVAGMADALGEDRFDLVGHDWGGAVAWVFATRHPERLRTLTVLSTPHFAALSAARAAPGSEQARRSSYFGDFAAPGAEERFLADDAAYLRSLWGRLPEDAVATYLEVLGNPAALRAALAWYAAAFGPAAGGAARGGGAAAPPPPITVPTLYVWSTEDPAFGREAAEATAEHVSGPYRFEVMEGVGHWVAEEAPEAVTRLLLEHIRSGRR